MTTSEQEEIAPVVALGDSPACSDSLELGRLGPLVALVGDEDGVAADEEEFDDDAPSSEPEPVPSRKTTARKKRTGTKIEKSYSSREVAEEFFGKSQQWLYWGQNATPPVFVYENGDPILPETIGGRKRRRYTLPLIREMAKACYRRGNLKEYGYWEASVGIGKEKVTARGDTAEQATADFIAVRGRQPEDIEYVLGLRDVFVRIEAAESDELVLSG